MLKHLIESQIFRQFLYKKFQDISNAICLVSSIKVLTQKVREFGKDSLIEIITLPSNFDISTSLYDLIWSLDKRIM